MSKLYLFMVTAAYLLQVATVGAQSRDTVYSGRLCDSRLKTLQMPLLAEVGDSATLDALLSQGADPRAHITLVEFRFGKDGSLRRLDVRGARSSSARAQIRDGVRAVVGSTTLFPGEFRINVVRLNATGRIRLLAETTTCAPRQHVTPQVTTLINRIHHAAPVTQVHRDAVVEFILEADGRVGDAWLERSTGFARVDSLALELFRAMRFDPAIVGATPVAVLVEQPFKF